MRLSAAVLSALLITGPIAASPLFVVSDLGSLGGAKSSAYNINSLGAVVGTAAAPSGAGSAFVSQGGSMSALPTVQGASSQANSINHSGTVAGTVYTLSGAQATVWAGGLFSNLGTLGGVDSYALAINDAGSVAGSATLSSGDAHAFLATNGGLTDLGTLGNSSWSAAYGVNNYSQVTGYSSTSDGGFRAFRWDANAGMIDIGTLGGSSYGMALNDAGDVVGASASPQGSLHAFLWTGGIMQDLGTLGGRSSSAYGINSSGFIVGNSYVPDSESTHAFLWMGAGLLDLNSFLPIDSGWVLNEAYGINDRGQIAGSGTYQGQTRAFRLDPLGSNFAAAVIIPEPGTLALLGAGAAVLAFRKRPS
ncbi:MAG: PEP-CTERM sorting domain-containing protein [Bryobacteraceae bacterium]